MYSLWESLCLCTHFNPNSDFQLMKMFVCGCITRKFAYFFREINWQCEWSNWKISNWKMKERFFLKNRSLYSIKVVCLFILHTFYVYELYHCILWYLILFCFTINVFITLILHWAYLFLVDFLWLISFKRCCICKRNIPFPYHMPI